ncbi:nucleoside deaminase [Polaribacter sp. WD7]|uniref:nucleoside deaminase n=1 Tax=Polaribacter sp. WD7 TaxID=2269061 RepID=UPI000DF40E39|nr:nucleoside deaminase [Polaribacter sp. WD7]RCS26356.1 nucleoside deaminase [Polaribacter sp. WD7]
MNKSYYISEAITLAHQCLEDKLRTPFGCVIVYNDKIVGKGKASTRIKNDPTAHAEIEAIRDASQNLKSTNLSGCTLFTSSEPCSMCLSAIHWSQIKMVYYSCSRKDVFDFGLPDAFELVEKRKNVNKSDFKKFEMVQIKNDKATQVFKDWLLKQKIQ